MAKYGEIENEISYVQATAGIAETRNSPGLDCKNLEQVAVFAFIGLLGAADTVDIKVQESDDDGATDAYADVTGAVFPQQVNANDHVTLYGKIRCNVAGRKRWLRIVNVNASTAGAASGVMIGYNRGGHKPHTVNALPAATFSV